MFSYDHITDIDYGSGTEYFFDSSLSWLFRKKGIGSFEDNYEVENALVKARVIQRRQCDSESCAFVANFKTKKAAHNFIDRLNKWVEERVRE